MRFIGLDVHLDFCEVAICEAGRVRSGGRVPTSPQGLAILANSLAPDDHVALEATGNALAIARRWSRMWRGSSWRRGRSCGRSPRPRSRPTVATRARSRGCWPPGCCAAAGCRMSRRGRCAGAWRAARSWCASARAAKNEVHAVLMRTLKGRPPMSDVFGRGGRVWLAELELPADERETVDGCLRQIDFLDGEIAILERGDRRARARL